MAIKGTLAKFSLADIFQFLERQQGTGLLLIQAPSDSPSQEGRETYIWLQKGRIVAAADRPDNQGLISLIRERGWLSSEELRHLNSSYYCSLDTPIGICLTNKGALTIDQLKLLFYVSVLQRVCALFKLKDGQFIFDTTATVPRVEMTGFSLSATAVTLLGLRVLRDWSSLAAKLPAPELVLCKAVSGKPTLKLDSPEKRVWQLVNGKVSVHEIANRLALPLETVQQIACRLRIVGLVEEGSMMVNTSLQSDRSRSALPVATTYSKHEKARVHKGSLAFLRPYQALHQQLSLIKSLSATT